MIILCVYVCVCLSVCCTPHVLITWNVNESNPFSMNVKFVECLLASKTVGHNDHAHLSVHKTVYMDYFTLDRSFIS